MKSLLIKGGHIIDPGQKIDGTGSVLVTGDKIAWLGTGAKSPPQKDYDVIDAKGMVVCPGFIDMHCHLREPGYEAKETIATGTRAAARGGFTTVCAMPNTNPTPDNKFVVHYVKMKAATEGVIRVLPVGCVSKGRNGKELADLGELAMAGVMGYSDDGNPVADSKMLRRALEYTLTFGLPIMDHCEDKNLAEGGQMNEGAVAARLGLKGIPAAVEEINVARDLALAKLTGGKMHICHVSAAGSVDLIRLAKSQGVTVTAECMPHHLTLTEERVMGYDTNAKVAPPLMTQKDIDALIAGLKDGTIDVIATDHAPHAEIDKNVEFGLAAPGFSGLETALGSLMGLVHAGKLPLAMLIAKMTNAPAKIIGDNFGKIGTLAVGASADITILDPDKKWVVDPRQFASKGKNTPLAGTTLKGKVMATIYQGKIVFAEDAISAKKS